MDNNVAADPEGEFLLAIKRTWRRGKKILTVIGAGVSRDRVPLMSEVIGYLNNRVVAAHGADARNEYGAILEDVGRWLTALAQGQAPRTVGAMAFGALQAASRDSSSPDNQLLADVWTGFTRDFLSNRIGKSSSERKSIVETEPSDFHLLLGKWILEERAIAISVNYDGLTRKALESQMATSRGATSFDYKHKKALIISNESDLKRYYFSRTSEPKLPFVIKVWGDVFHTVCQTPSCPNFSTRRPISDLENEQIPHCPGCGRSMHLQIFFPGYREKEESTHRLTEMISKCLLTEIGLVLVVGLSGRWDHALVDFIADVQRSLDSEHSGGVTPPNCICIDPDPNPFIVKELVARGLEPLHLTFSADEFVNCAKDVEAQIMITDGKSTAEDDPPSSLGWPALSRKTGLETPDWFRKKCTNPASYLEKQRRLRQLGIKTSHRLWAGSTARSADPKVEKHHNRRIHEGGTALVASFWLREVVDKLPASFAVDAAQQIYVKNLVYFAALHHDIGHMPFTHMAEEILDEIHWNLHEWTDDFRHDMAILGTAHDNFKKELEGVLQSIVGEKRNLRSLREFTHAAETAMQGRSGYPFVDAILNSPIDADKIDYVFRDCSYLGQGLHIPVDLDGAGPPGERSSEWVKHFISEMKILDSGILGLDGPTGIKAFLFLEERRWLYQHQYFKPGFRFLERLARAITIMWLLHEVPGRILTPQASLLDVVGDVRAIKGGMARTLLWDLMTAPRTAGTAKEPIDNEVSLLQEILHQLKEKCSTPAGIGLKISSKVLPWLERCNTVFEKTLPGYGDCPGIIAGNDNLLFQIERDVGCSYSEPLFVNIRYLDQVREIVRALETERPFHALFDVVVPPMSLSYPKGRRFTMGTKTVVSECYAVPHRDPQKWGMSADKWIPLSESFYAEMDKNRHFRVTVYSPYPNDREVVQAEDRFRYSCRVSGIEVFEEDPSVKDPLI